jgi:hypothetical protein
MWLGNGTVGSEAAIRVAALASLYPSIRGLVHLITCGDFIRDLYLYHYLLPQSEHLSGTQDSQWTRANLVQLGPSIQKTGEPEPARNSRPATSWDSTRAGSKLGSKRAGSQASGCIERIGHVGHVLPVQRTFCIDFFALISIEI